MPQPVFGFRCSSLGYQCLDALVLGHVDFQSQPLTALHKTSLCCFPEGPLGPRFGLGSTQSAGEEVLEKPRELYSRAKAG